MTAFYPQPPVESDRLPDSAYVGVRVVDRARGRSINRPWRRAEDDSLSAPFVPGQRMTRWNVDEGHRSLYVDGGAGYAA